MLLLERVGLSLEELDEEELDEEDVLIESEALDEEDSLAVLEKLDEGELSVEEDAMVNGGKVTGVCFRTYSHPSPSPSSSPTSGVKSPPEPLVAAPRRLIVQSPSF